MYRKVNPVSSLLSERISTLIIMEVMLCTQGKWLGNWYVWQYIHHFYISMMYTLFLMNLSPYCTEMSKYHALLKYMSPHSVRLTYVSSYNLFEDLAFITIVMTMVPQSWCWMINTPDTFTPIQTDQSEVNSELIMQVVVLILLELMPLP
jgi:hypothetical protein